MTRRLAVLVAALTVACAWFVVTAPDGNTAGNLQAAWWWQGEPATGALPAPPTVPDGGLWVSSNASGPQSISAVRISLDPGDSAPVLTLDVHQSVPPNDAEMLAYPTSTAWAAGPAQTWATRPTYDPVGVRAQGSLSSDGKHLTFDLSGLVTSGDLSVVIVPNAAAAAPPQPLPAPPASPPPTFDVSFEKPGPGNVTVSPAPAPSSDVDASSAAAPASPSVDTTPLPADSFSGGLPTGLSAPLPALATSSPPARARAPVVAFNSVPRRFLPVSVKRSFGDSAAIAVMLGIVLLWLARDTAGSGIRRPRLSLYDAPKPAEALAGVARTGAPPPIR